MQENKNIDNKYNSAKQLPEVFKELQEMRKNVTVDASKYYEENYKDRNIYYKNNASKSKKIKMRSKINRYICRLYEDLKIRRIKFHNVSITLSILTIMLIGITLTTNTIFAQETDIEEKPQVEKVDFEENENSIDILEVLSNNISVTTRKDVIAEEGEITYSTAYRENNKLPKGEEKIAEEGINGKKETTFLRTYENDEMISEKIISFVVLEEPKKQIIEIGTSEYLAKHNVHIGEKMYLSQDAELKEAKDENSNTIQEIWVYMDVTLLDFDENWCKVQYDDKTGYLKNDILITETTNPDIVEISRKQRILSKVGYDMLLNEPSNLTKEDFKKLLTDPNDKNKIFENSSDFFYDMEQKYGINGVFLAAVGIHESGWGTSKIASNKNNLFGYMAYDRSPYEYSASFDTYEEGIETLAKVFCKYYMYPVGTPIYDGEVALGSYYNGATVSGVNIRYASDPEWSNKVYDKMIYLYSKLP